MRSPALIAALLALAALASAAFADDDARRLHSLRLGNDEFVAGGSVFVSEAVKGDLIAAGGQLRLTGAVGGDAVAAGGSVRVDGPVEQNLYAAGGRVTLDGAVARNARIAGGSVTIDPGARINGNASLTGGQVEMRGAVAGYLQASGGHVLIDGPIQGDVLVAAGSLELGSQARITGKLRYRARDILPADQAAKVQGGVERLELRMPAAQPRRYFRQWGFGIWTLGLMVLAIVWVWALPGFSSRVAETARQRPGWSLLAGFIALVAGPPAVVVLAITVIGLPLALLTALLYVGLLVLGYVATGVALGDAGLRRWHAEHAGSTARRAAAAALGVLSVSLLALIPWVKGLIILVVLIAGMGSLVLQIRLAPASTATA